MKNIVVLGSTGSIGVAALEVIRKLGPGYRVLGLAARANAAKVLEQARQFRPRWVTLFEPEAAAQLQGRLPRGTQLLAPGVESLMEQAAHSDTHMVVSGLSGGVGFGPLVAAVKAGKTIALANKEPLVMAGATLMAECRRWNASIIPVDSEASAVFQSLDRRNASGVRRVLLTASGGPFFRYKGKLDKVTPAQALRHPRWRMGKKISIDSATLMNKGFEAIEIAQLFGLSPDKIEIVIHPQSVVHSAVEHEDGSVIAQLSQPDMRLPIQYAITYPERRPCPVKSLSVCDMAKLEFYKPDLRRFPCLELALEAARKGGTAPAALSGADEQAVESFLSGRLSFTGIASVVEAVLARHRGPSSPPSLAAAVEAEQWGRETASAFIESKFAIKAR